MPAGRRRKPEPELTEFQRLIRHRRDMVQKSLAQVATEIHVKPEFIAMVEAGKRHIKLNRAPDLARALEFDPKEFCKRALFEAAPELFRVLYEEEVAPTVKEVPPDQANILRLSPAAADFWQRFSALSDDLQEAIYKIVRKLYGTHTPMNYLPDIPYDDEDE